MYAPRIMGGFFHFMLVTVSNTGISFRIQKIQFKPVTKPRKSQAGSSPGGLGRSAFLEDLGPVSSRFHDKPTVPEWAGGLEG